MGGLEVRFWAATDVGLTRDHNEDNFLVDKKLNLFIVADGMGGHAAGEVASSVAVREVRRLVAEAREVVEAYLRADTPSGRQAMLDLIDAAIRGACARVFELAQESPDRRGMGTTLSMMLVAGRRGFIGHVGDSRVYLARGDQVHQLTEDHSLINELIKRGRLKPGDEFDSPYKNAVTRAVGVYETVEVDTFDFDILPGDNYLLCSDGLSGYLDDAVTYEHLSHAEIKEVPDRFIAFANDCGGKDNITAVVVRILDAVEDEQRRRTAEIRQRLSTLRAVPLLRYLDYKGLVKIHNLVEIESHEAGSVVFQEGTRNDALHILISGGVRLMRRGLPVGELRAGGAFGELALVDKAPPEVSALVTEPTRLMVLRRAPLYEAMGRDARLAMKLMWSMVQVVHRRFALARAELGHAVDTIERVRRAPGTLADLPQLEVSGVSLSALPVAVTDELVPGFLFIESDAGTDPLIRKETTIDPDDRPGLGPRRAATPALAHAAAGVSRPTPPGGLAPVIAPPVAPGLGAEGSGEPAARASRASPADPRPAGSSAPPAAGPEDEP
jgi:serine/threonine protein phosphatase PrpC/CRP-like cAMP-binding protein